MELMRLLSAVGLGSLIGSLVGYHGFAARELCAAIGFFTGGAAAWIVLHVHEIPSALYRVLIAEVEYRQILRTGANICIGAVPIFATITAVCLVNYVLCYVSWSILPSIEQGHVVLYSQWTDRDLVAVAIGSSAVAALGLIFLSVDEDAGILDLTARNFIVYANPLAIVVFIVCILSVLAWDVVCECAWRLGVFVRETILIIGDVVRAIVRFVRAIPWFCRTTWRVLVNTIVAIHTHLSTIAFVSAGLGGGVGAYFYGNFTLGVAVGLAAALLDFVWVRPAVLRLRS